jgi:hypothetical protein
VRFAGSALKSLGQSPNIHRAIAKDEKRPAPACANLSQVDARLALFEASGEPGAPYVDTHRLFARGALRRWLRAFVDPVSRPCEAGEVTPFLSVGR